MARVYQSKYLAAQSKAAQSTSSNQSNPYSLAILGKVQCHYTTLLHIYSAITHPSSFQAWGLAKNLHLLYHVTAHKLLIMLTCKTNMPGCIIPHHTLICVLHVCIFLQGTDSKYDISHIMETWTGQMGFPVVTLIHMKENTYRLEQERFLLNPDDTYDPNTSPYR